MKAEVVKLSELGTNCWLAVRFTGGECPRADTCSYPEKKTCKAYKTMTRRTYVKERMFAAGGSEVVESGAGLGTQRRPDEG